MPSPKTPKPDDEETPRAEGAGSSYIRPHEADEVVIPPQPSSSGTALADAIDDLDEFLDRWMARHFSLSVKLFDVQRAHTASGDEDHEADAILADVNRVHGVLFELHEYASHDARVQAFLRDAHTLQHGVIAVYEWFDETLDALAERGIARRRPSFVDEEEQEPPFAMLRTVERLHPDLELLVRGAPVDEDVARKLALCFRQIGAAVVRISGRGTTMPPPMR